MAVPTPAAPASTVQVANTTGQYVTVTLSGATVTNVFRYDPAAGAATQIGTALAPTCCRPVTRSRSRTPAP